MRPTAPPAAPGARGPANAAAGASAAAGAAAPARDAGSGRWTSRRSADGPLPRRWSCRGYSGCGRAARGRWRGGRRLQPRARRTWPRRRARGSAAAADRRLEVDRRRLRRHAGDGQMPIGKATDEWVFGNVDEAMKKADLVLDETFMTQSTGHQPLETRTAMAYWQNGKLYLHGSTQSTVQTVASVARWTGTHAGQGRASSASTRAAASAARFRAPSRWRFRRCSRRKPTRR